MMSEKIKPSCLNVRIKASDKSKSQNLCLSRYSIKILFLIYNTKYDFTFSIDMMCFLTCIKTGNVS